MVDIKVRRGSNLKEMWFRPLVVINRPWVTNMRVIRGDPPRQVQVYNENCLMVEYRCYVLVCMRKMQIKENVQQNNTISVDSGLPRGKYMNSPCVMERAPHVLLYRNFRLTCVTKQIVGSHSSREISFFQTRHMWNDQLSFWKLEFQFLYLLGKSGAKTNLNDVQCAWPTILSNTIL